MEGMRREGVGLRKECTEGAGDGGLDGGNEARATTEVEDVGDEGGIRRRQAFLADWSEARRESVEVWRRLEAAESRPDGEEAGLSETREGERERGRSEGRQEKREGREKERREGREEERKKQGTGKEGKGRRTEMVTMIHFGNVGGWRERRKREREREREAGTGQARHSLLD
jgi:hypothetical protein